jgi:hypothetical protein
VEAQSKARRRVMRPLWLSEHLFGSLAQTSVHWQRLGALILAILTLTGLVLLLGRWGIDDQFITYRYARNLLLGHGLVYNVGQRTLSTTAPLYAVLLAGLGSLWPNLPALSNVLSAVTLVSSAAILVAWSRSRGQFAMGLVAGLYLCVWPLLLTTFGIETCLYMMLVLAGFFAYDRSNLPLAAGALALAALVRPDAVVAAAALGLYHLIRRQPVDWRPLALYVAVVGAWYGGLWLYYGSPLPVTLLTKQQQGQMSDGLRFGPRFLSLIRGYGHQPLYWVHGVLAVLGLGGVVARWRHWMPLVLWAGLYFVVYLALGVNGYLWYYAPLVPALVVLIAAGAQVVGRFLGRLRVAYGAKTALLGLLLALLLAPLVVGTLDIVWQPDAHLAVYREIGQWLEARTAPSATVGTLEVGIIGYYSQRDMVGFAGLIQPEVARQLTPSTTYEDSARWAIQTYEPDYVVLPRGIFSGLVESDAFRQVYEPVRDFGDGQRLWMSLYRRRESP